MSELYNFEMTLLAFEQERFLPKGFLLAIPHPRNQSYNTGGLKSKQRYTGYNFEALVCAMLQECPHYRRWRISRTVATWRLSVIQRLMTVNKAKSVAWNLNFQFGFLPKISSHLSSRHVSVTASRTPWTRIQFLLPRVSRGRSLSTFFPYHVDPLWKEILLKFPDYWTRVVSQKPTGVYDYKTSNETHFLLCLSYAVPGKILTMRPKGRMSRTSWTSWGPICITSGPPLLMYTRARPLRSSNALLHIHDSS